MCFILNDAPSVSFLLSPINLISTMEQKLLCLVWSSISIANALVYTDLIFECVEQNSTLPNLLLFTIDCKLQFSDGLKIIISNKLTISVGNLIDLLFGCHQHLNIHISCISGDNAFTGVLGPSLSSRWQHCSTVLFLALVWFGLIWVFLQVKSFAPSSGKRKKRREFQMVMDLHIELISISNDLAVVLNY